MMDFSERHCNALTVMNAEVSHKGKAIEGALVTVKCSNTKRYHLIGANRVRCTSSGDWTEVPECRKCGEYLLRPSTFKTYRNR